MKNQKKSAAVAVRKVEKTVKTPKVEKSSKATAPAAHGKNGHTTNGHSSKLHTASDSAGILSNGERNVLKVFRGYRMTAGHMLCFNSNDHAAHKTSLGHLIRKGILREERFKGAYCLTPYGYTLMQAAASMG